MGFAFIEVAKACFPIVLMCSVLKVSRSGFYAWRRREPGFREQQDKRLGVEVAAIYAGTKRRYGSPRIHIELQAQGHSVSRKRVARLMRERGLVVRKQRRFCRTIDSNHAFPIAPNLLQRQFRGSEPNRAWVGDITYLHSDQGWLYLAVVLDLFSRRYWSWPIGIHHKLQKRPKG